MDSKQSTSWSVEMKGNKGFDSNEKEFRYTREFVSPVKAGGVVKTEEFKVEMETQEENVRDLLSKLQPEDVVVFTDQPLKTQVQQVLVGWCFWMGMKTLFILYLHVTCIRMIETFYNKQWKEF